MVWRSMTVDALQNQADDISELLVEKLRIKGSSLAEQAALAKKKLPRAIYRDLRLILETLDMAGHPKIALTLETKKADQSAERVLTYLREINRWELIKTRWIGILSAISFVLILLFIFLVYVYWKRGLI